MLLTLTLGWWEETVCSYIYACVCTCTCDVSETALGLRSPLPFTNLGTLQGLHNRAAADNSSGPGCAGGFKCGHTLTREGLFPCTCSEGAGRLLSFLPGPRPLGRVRLSPVLGLLYGDEALSLEGQHQAREGGDKGTLSPGRLAGSGADCAAGLAGGRFAAAAPVPSLRATPPSRPTKANLRLRECCNTPEAFGFAREQVGEEVASFLGLDEVCVISDVTVPSS